MPYTAEQRRWAVEQSGYDPDKFDMDDDGYINPRVSAPTTAQPAVAANGMPQPKLPAPAGALETFGKEAIHAAPAAAAGGAVFMPAFGAVTGATAPFLGPYAPVAGAVGGIGASLLAALGVSKAQGAIEEAVVPEYVAQRQANVAASPWSAMGGRLSANIAGGFNPSLLNPVKAAGTIYNTAGRTLDDGIVKAIQGVKPAETANLLNVGGGAALGSGIAAGQQMAHGASLGEALTSQDTLEGALGGLLFTKPNAIGKGLGFSSGESAGRVATLDQNESALSAIQREISKRTETALDPRIDAAKLGLTEKKEGKDWSLDKKDLLTANEAAAQRGINPEVARSMEAERVKAAGLLTPEEVYQQKIQKEIERLASVRRKADFEKAQFEIQQQAEAVQQELDAVRTAKAAMKQQQQLQMKLGTKATPEAILARSFERPELRRKSTPGLKARVDAMQAEPIDPLQDEADAIQERLERKNQEDEDGIIQTELQKEAQAALAKAGKSAKSSDVWNNLFKMFGESNRGVEASADTALGSKGATWLQEGLKKLAVKWDPNSATVDTMPHELLGHAFMKHLEHSTYPSDKKIVSRLRDLVSKDPEFAAINQRRVAAGKEAWTPDEFIAQQQGVDYVLRDKALNPEGEWKAWWRDFKSQAKSIMGNATQSDLRRLVDYKWHNDPVFEKYFGKAAGKTIPAAGARVNMSSDEGFNTEAGDEVFSNNDDVEVVDALPTKLPPPPEGYRRVRVKKPDGGSYEAFFNDKYYEMGEMGRFASVANMLPDGKLSHTVTKKGEVIEELPSQVYRRDEGTDEGLTADPKRAARLAAMRETSKNRRATNIAERKQMFADAGIASGTRQVKGRTIDVAMADIINLVNKFGRPSTGKIPKSKMVSLDKKTAAGTELSELIPIDDVQEAELDISYAHMYEIMQERLKELQDDLASSTGSEAEKLKQTIEEYQKGMEFVAKQDPAKTVDLKALSGKRVNEGMDEGLKVYDKLGVVGKGIRSHVAPEVEQLRADNPVAGAGAQKFYELNRALRGQYEQSLIHDIKSIRPAKSLTEFIFQDNPDYAAVVKWRDAMQDGDNPGFDLTATQQEISAAIDRNLKTTIDAREGREGLKRGTKQTPYYLPQVMSRKVSKILAEKPNSTEGQQYLKDFLAFRKKKGQTEEEALADWDTLRGQFVRTEKSNMAAQFGAIDKAAGLGLPVSMRETNLMDRMARFNRHFARRVAYEDAIGSKPEVKSAFFNQRTGVGSTKAGKNVLEDIFGIREYNEATRSAIAGVVRALMLGPLTGAKDVVAGQFLGLQHMDYDQVMPAKLAALRNWKDARKKAITTGIIRDNIGALETGDTGFDRIQDIAGRSRDVINVVQGRQLLENTSRVLNFGEGQYLATDAITRYKDGLRLSEQRQKFLNDFLPDYEKYKSEPVPAEVIDEAAAKYVESVQGTYDYRGLPSVAMRGSLALPLSLQRWSVEKFNNFTRHVVEPATKGNYKPLLMSTIGMFVGGAAVNALVEEITGRKSKAPTWKEVGESKEQTELLAYKLASLASMSGYAGVLGDSFKAAMDAKLGNKVQTWNNPLIEGFSTALEDTKFLVEAASEGDFPEVVDILHMVLSDYVQAYRIANAQLSDETQNQTDTANKRRDLKVFEIGQGLPRSSSDSKRPNPLLNKDMRKFKQTDDMAEAIALVNPLVKRALEKAAGNPEVLAAELSKLKRNSYQTVPSPERSPLKFVQYRDFLTRTQGADEATNRITDYMRRNALNRAKSSLIP